MKIALVQEYTSTGGWSYTYLLAKSIKNLKPDCKVSIIVQQFTLSTYSKEDIEKIGVEVIQVPFSIISPQEEIKKKRLKDFFRHKKDKQEKSKTLQEILSEYDIIHYTWPYTHNPIDVDVPAFFIPHDFIYTHFVGSYFYFNEQDWLNTRTLHQKFIDKGVIPIVSSNFIANEFKRTFPEYKKDINVVYIPTFNDLRPMHQKEVTSFLDKLKIKDEYILYANNWAIHKNLGQVLAAYYWVKQKYPNIKLIVTGYGTENLTAISNNPYYVDRVQGDIWDIKALGLVPNDEFSALIQGAKMVINASLIEAASGSGVDSWSLGTPIVMSAIEAFKEQSAFLGTKAEFFDPRNSHDIARAIIYLLENPDIANERAKISKEAMQKYTREDFAQQYLDIFEKGIDTHKK